MELPDDDPWLIDRMIIHCYKGSYEPRQGQRNGKVEPNYVTAVAINAGMYALADKYGMEALEKEALEHFKEGIQNPMNDFFPFKILSCVVFIFTSTPDNKRDLRDLVVTYIVDHLPEVAGHPGLPEIAAQVPQFAIECFLGMARAPPKTVKDFVQNSSFCGECCRCHRDDDWTVRKIVCACGRWKNF